jgi:ABC-type transport system involved in multi-copper enzyme maturation permease subunit
MRSIWAVAVNTIRQALRLKIAVVFIILLAVLLPVMGLTATGDGTVKGRLQTFISYGLSLAGLLLCLLTIIVSVHSVTSDISGRQIYTVVTKPIRRFQILTGKLLGVIVLDLVLLILFTTVIYVITVMTPKFVGASDEEVALLKDEFFTARAGLKPEPVDVSKDVQQTFKSLVQRGQITQEQLANEDSRRQIIEELTRSKELASRSAAVGQELVWQFNNVKIKSTESGALLFIRFKYEVSVQPPDMMVNSVWEVGDDRDIRLGQPPKTKIEQVPRRDKIKAFHEIKVGADVVASDGYLAVGFINPPQLNDTVVIFPPDGLEVLYKADSFSANFVRAVLLIFLRLIFLSCLGVFAASFLSMPTALLFCLIVFATASVSNFVFESFDTLNKNTNLIYSVTVKPLLRILPRFDEMDPSRYLIPSRLLSWLVLGWTGLVVICVKSLLLFLLGVLFFSRREIAKIIV